jgi:arylformamidase
VAPYKHSRPTHEILLSAGVVIIEGLDLTEVSQGRYTLYCLPLKLLGSDGAPARAILIGV